MDPYIGQQLVSHKEAEMRAAAESERLARLASIGARPLWHRALDWMPVVIQSVTPRLSILDAARIIQHWGVLRRVLETVSRPRSAPEDAASRLAESECGSVDGSADIVTLSESP